MPLENILIKNLIIDFDRQKIIRSMSAYATQGITLYKDTNYIFRANVIASVVNNTPIVFQNDDTFTFAFGDIFGSGASPVVVTDTGFNDSSDWSSVNIATGNLCWRVDTSGGDLSTDMDNATSKKYILNLWCFNVNKESVLICSGDVTVNNVINFPESSSSQSSEST